MRGHFIKSQERVTKQINLIIPIDLESKYLLIYYMKQLQKTNELTQNTHR